MHAILELSQVPASGHLEEIGHRGTVRPPLSGESVDLACIPLWSRFEVLAVEDAREAPPSPRPDFPHSLLYTLRVLSGESR